MVLRSPVRLASYGPTLRLSSCSHRGEVGGHTASWVGSEVTAAEYAGMHGHCHASGGGGWGTGSRGEESRHPGGLETTMGSEAPQQFLRLGPGQAEVLALEDVGRGSTAPQGAG